MSAPLKVLIISIIWLVYTFLLFSLNVESDAPDPKVPVTEEQPEGEDGTAVNTYPIGFLWSIDTAYTTDRFPQLKQSLLADMKEKSMLEITGLYFEEEEKPADAATMGFARAENVKALLAGDIPADRINLRARTVEEKEGVRTGYFEAVEFKWIEPEETVEETVEELEDRIIIRFPYGSAQKDYDPTVDQYLKKLAKRVSETGEKVSLTGHADNTGSTDFNYQLALDRAKAIRKVLVKNGVDQSQISVESKGETQPVASNDTEEGRHNNRRVEVRLITN